MAKKLIKGIVYLISMFLLISAISFLVIKAAPNSFMASGELNPNMTPEAIEKLQNAYGLNKPLLEQYTSWLVSLSYLDFGVSFASGKQVSAEIFARLPLTLYINISSMVLIFIFGIFLGIYMAINNNSKQDSFLSNFSILSYAMPSFYLALIFVMTLSVWLGLFPISGTHSNGLKMSGIDYALDYAWHLVLPIGVITFTGIGSLALYTRSLTLEILKTDYIFFARSRGIGGFLLIRKYILPNLSSPLITMIGLSLPAIFGGGIILESIFGLNGMGLYFYQATLSRDYPVIMGITMIGAFLTLLGNLLADILLSILDPNAKNM